MGDRICNTKDREYPGEKQNAEMYSNGEIGSRSKNLINLIGAERVSRREFIYEGTYYVTEDGETYDKKYVNTHKPLRTGVSFYEVSNWIYNERRQMYMPVIRRIVMIKITNTQLSLKL